MYLIRNVNLFLMNIARMFTHLYQNKSSKKDPLKFAALMMKDMSLLTKKLRIMILVLIKRVSMIS